MTNKCGMPDELLNNSYQQELASGMGNEREILTIF